MTAVFNSLGSNYSPAFRALCLNQLVQPWTWRSFQPNTTLVDYLSHQFHGHVQLFYKGRHALTYTLKYFHISSVITQAFTCWAVEEAISAAGATPIFADIQPNSTNLSLSTLTSIHLRHPQAQAVIVQHTLGSMVDLKAISAYCRRHDLILIEDQAHSYYPSESQIKLYADAVILSFGRDKLLDAISGGASIIRRPNSTTTLSIKFHHVSNYQIIKDLFYPLLTFLITSSYSYIIGRIFHKFINFLHLFSSPITGYGSGYYHLPATHARLVLHALDQYPHQIKHRSYLADTYRRCLPSSLQLSHSKRNLFLRFPIQVTNRPDLLNFLKKRHFYLYDTWYRQPVETGQLSVTSHYLTGTAPEAEKLSRTILNLPTHLNTTPKQARYLSKSIVSYLKHHP